MTPNTLEHFKQTLRTGHDFQNVGLTPGPTGVSAPAHHAGPALSSVIAFSGQADTQRPQERQASTFGV